MSWQVSKKYFRGDILSRVDKLITLVDCPALEQVKQELQQLRRDVELLDLPMWQFHNERLRQVQSERVQKEMSDE